MCGVVGFLGGAGPAEENAAIGRRMADLILHRGPDDVGVWVDNEAEIVMAHRRLSIVDLSPSGHQPMTSACGRYVIVFNGEIYNYEDIRRKLDAESAHHWSGHSDTEVLLEAIARWGIKAALTSLVGMFAFALWDRRERTLILARDRLGEKPLYYGRIGRSFAFASELKAFRAHPAWDPVIDRNSIALMMRHNYVPAPYSIYQGFRKLRPAHFLVLADGEKEPRIESYWSPREIAEAQHARQFKGSPDDAVKQLEFLLEQSLKGQMMADVPLGAFLSGGIDSSAIVSVMQSLSSDPIRTFTIGFHNRDYNEADRAKEVAQHLGTQHTELYISEREAMDVVRSLPEIYCEPFSDSSQIPTFLVSKLAREKVTVSLSGDGGDELFSGYTRYGLADELWKKVSRVPGSVRRTAANLATIPSPALLDRLAGPLMALLPKHHRRTQVGDKIHKAAELLSFETVDDVYRRLCSHWTNPEHIVPGSYEPATMLTGLEPLPTLSGSVERMMYIDLLSYLPDDILVKVDRAAMAVGLETRVPLLDHRIVEFAMSLPLSLLRAEGKTKWPLRQLLYKHVPRKLVERPKMGFGIPVGEWLRGDLREWAEDLLSESRLKNDGFFNPLPIRNAWQDHISGKRNYQYPLWDVLMFQAWYASQ